MILYLHSGVSADSLESAAQQTDKLVEILTALLGREDRLSFEPERGELVRLREQKAAKSRNSMQRLRLYSQTMGCLVDDELKSLTDRLSKLRQEWANTQADLDQSDGKITASAEKLRVAVPATLNDGSPAPLPTGRASRISPDDYGKLTTKKLDSEVDSRGLRARLAANERAYNGLVPRIQAVTDVKAQNDLLTARLASAKRDYGADRRDQELTIRQTTGEGELRVRPSRMGRWPVSPSRSTMWAPRPPWRR
jgi:hypothetical protein